MLLYFTSRPHPMPLLNTKIISKPIEDVLKAVSLHRYMTAQDVTYLFYSPKAITYVRELLFDLSGRGDYKPNQYLYRFPLPHTGSGRTFEIYTLGSRGRSFLQQELGLVVEWYFKPHKIKHLSHNFLMHALILTRFLVAACYFCKTHPNFKIGELTISYQLEQGEFKKPTTVIPDAWFILDEERQNGRHFKTPIFLEIDRGSTFKQQFREHVRSRLEYVRSGAYEHDFKTEAVLIAYATTGQLPEYQQSRREAICRWTYELLEELNMKEWAGIFRICSIDWKRLLSAHIFDESVWYQPGGQRPIRLLGG